ncbi:heme peroxidase [Rhodococcus marinonascens]|uniref:heme peroxidase n=1 Tax=Rhodococcus marinonascens TaxID=38311 RepID=UPI000932587D|nr:heme peroxidase [Rhodococcus marinonascens]
MTVSADALETVVTACRDRLGDPSGWVTSVAYRRSLALCIIESVQSRAGHSEAAVVDRYLAYRRARLDQPVTDGARDLLRTFEEAGSSDQWAGKVGSYKRRYCATGVQIEARHIQQAAERLHQLRINSIDDLLEAAHDEAALEQIHDAWVEVCGESSDVTWAHFLMLAGIPGVRPNRVADIFVSGALGISGTADASHAEEILEATAAELGVDPDQLDYAIRRWLSANSRRVDEAA